MSRLMQRHAPTILSALITAAVTLGGALLTYGERMGRAEATAEFWKEWAEGLQKRCP